jgi:ketosteroid isomerase-like protein
MNTNTHRQSSSSPESVVRALYAAVERGQPAAIAALLDESVVFHVPGRSPNTGDYRGKGAVLSFLQRAAELTGGTLALELGDVATGRHHVFALARYTARRLDRSLENRLTHVLRVRDGRVVESWFYTGDQYAVDAFWADEGDAGTKEAR